MNFDRDAGIMHFTENDQEFMGMPSSADLSEAPSFFELMKDQHDEIAELFETHVLGNKGHRFEHAIDLGVSLAHMNKLVLELDGAAAFVENRHRAGRLVLRISDHKVARFV
ncbi:MAG TPA: hypothetical protein VFH99_00680 [Candidatus Saccharimonadales bacterium]|nr:hypothetical protein [Candidatus Saccharimonadales bacterium]